MEALRTRNDNLQWEVNRLDAENRKLRSENPDLGARVDLESELEQAKNDVATLSQQAETCRAQLVELRASARSEDERAANVDELERTRDSLQTATAELAELRETNAGLATEVEVCRARETELEQRREELEKEREEDLRELQERTSREMESALRDAELDRYRALEAERGRWEAREARLVEQLETVKRELDKGRGVDSGAVTTLTCKLAAVEKQLQVATSELETSKRLVARLQSERDSAYWEVGKLQEELASLQVAGKELEGGTESALVMERTRLRAGATAFVPTTGGSGSSSVGAEPATGDSSSPSRLPVSSGLPVDSGPASSMPSVAFCGSEPSTLPSSGRSPTSRRVTFTPTASAAVGEGSSSTVTTSVAPLTSTATTMLPMPVGGTAPVVTAGLVSPQNLLPHIPPYHGGEQKDGETFADWLEHFEAVAQLARWDDHYKFVYLTTALRGTAKAFYRSCSPMQKSNYHSLVAELRKRFTPVQLTAVRTQLFHDRKQGPQESVDEFAQDLRDLYGKAYAGFTKGTPEAEKVGQTVLASQFVAGLRPSLQSKVVGMEGGMDQLVLKARFEEAKSKELAAARPGAGAKSNKVNTNGRAPSGTPWKGERGVGRTSSGDATHKCYNCGLEGHFARECSYPKQNKKDVEARGKKRATVTSLQEAEGGTEGELEQLRQRLRDLEMKTALKRVSTMEGDNQPHLGPTVFVDVEVNGAKTTALVDTGSPATIISLDYVMEIMASQRDHTLPVEQWRKQTLGRFSAPAVTLKSYGGHHVDIVSQTQLQLALGERKTDSTVLVQKGAPNKLLLGTDVQPKLGIALVVQRVDMLTRSPISGQDEDQPPATGAAESTWRGPEDQRDFGEQKPQLQDSRQANSAGSPTGGAPPQLQELTRDEWNNCQPLDSPSRGEDPQCQGGSKPQEISPMSLDPEPPPQSGEPRLQRRQPQLAEVSLPAVSHADGGETQGGALSPTGVVRLLQTTKVPAGYKKIIRGRIQKSAEGRTMMLFTPSIGRTDVTLADGVIDSREEECATLIIENHGTDKLKLKKGMVLGVLEAVDDPDEMQACGAQEWDGESEGQAVALDAAPAVMEPVEQEKMDGRIGGPPDNTEAAVSRLKGELHHRTAKLLEQLQLDSEQLTPEEKTQLRTLLEGYADIFALEPSELGTSSVIQHSINTGDHPPIRQPLRRMPFTLRPQVDKLVQEMLTQGVIQPSSSPWASPVVLVRKKDGTMRFCVDYRRLNGVTKLDQFPLPRIDDTLDVLAGAKYFTTLDMASGYWQVAMEPSSVEKTAFTTYSGLYEFRRMPFGLVNAPATFQRLMEHVLAGLARSRCLVYLDDVLVIGSTWEEHNANLEEVFKRLRRAGLRLKPKKCKFAQGSVIYLGHVISKDGIATDPEKVAAVHNYPVPTNIKSLRSFLGLASYYRRFVPGFSRVAGPLHAMTRKDALYCWGSDCQSSFEELKRRLTTSPVLVFPDFSRCFILETDASIAGLGAVLAQEQPDSTKRPIAYASRSLLKHERNYGVTELEGLGVVWAVKHFRPYLYGNQCIVYTDHQALKSLLNTPQPSGKLARWGMALQEMNLIIQHRSGKHNENADALSRYPHPQTVNDDADPTDGVVAALAGEVDGDLATLQRQDEELGPMVTYLETGVLPDDAGLARRLALTQSQFVIEDDVLYWVAGDSTLRVVPPACMRPQLFQEAHSGQFGGHLGGTKVHSQLQKHYWWRGMRADITRWSRACLVCATYNSGRAVRPPLSPIPVAGPFDRVGVDVIQFPRSRAGNQYAVVFMDYLTKWPEVFAVPDQTAATIAQLLVEEVVSRHGVPTEILSDRGRSFLSGLMKEVEVLLGFHKVNTTAYHPQTDGLVERYNRTLTAMLAKTAQDSGRNWDKRLPYVLFAYRACCQESTRESPFFLVYGRDPRLPTPAVLNPKKTRATMDLREYGIELHSRMSAAWELAQQNITRAQKRQKAVYDQKSRPARFREGERVFLFKPAEKTGHARKLARPFHGPYRVVEIDNNTAKVCRVDKPSEEPVLVALERLRRCPDEIGDVCWPPAKATRQTQIKPSAGVTEQPLCAVPEGMPQLTEEGRQPTRSKPNPTMPDKRTGGCLGDRAVVRSGGGEAPAETGLEREGTPNQPEGPDEDSLLGSLFREDEDFERDSDRTRAELGQSSDPTRAWEGRLRRSRHPPKRLLAEDGCS